MKKFTAQSAKQQWAILLLPLREIIKITIIAFHVKQNGEGNILKALAG